MKSLVTGGAGFIGSHIVKKLLSLGHEVISVDLQPSDNTTSIVGDIRDYNLMKDSMKGVDYVFHLAAESKIGPCIENPIQAIGVNDLGTCTLLQCARENGVKRFVYSSTSAAYGGNELPNVETQPDDCLNPYSVSKVSGEKLCKMYTDLYGLPTVILRYFNVYGEGQHTSGQYAPVMGIFSRQHAAGEPLTIVGDGEQRRDFVHVSDVARANVMVAIANQEEQYYGQVYNVGSGVNYSVNQIAKMISDNTINIPARPGEARATLADCDKIKKTFGWRPEVNLEDWIRENG